MKCNLKQLRKEKNISQNEIANELKVRQTTISEWENNNAVPNLKIAYELAELLKVNVTNIWE